MNEARPQILGQVLNSLGILEGKGDRLTDTPTGVLGVTRMARLQTGLLKASDTEVALAYLTYLGERWRSVEGYEEAPEGVRHALLDTSYNLGPSVMSFPRLRESLRVGRYGQTLLELLDTANIDGRSVKGLAVRRAKAFNLGSVVKVVEVEQMSSGVIKYRDASGREIFRYKPRRGKHEGSDVGVLNVGGSM